MTRLSNSGIAKCADGTVVHRLEICWPSWGWKEYCSFCKEELTGMHLSLHFYGEKDANVHIGCLGTLIIETRKIQDE